MDLMLKTREFINYVSRKAKKKLSSLNQKGNC